MLLTVVYEILKELILTLIIGITLTFFFILILILGITLIIQGDGTYA